MSKSVAWVVAALLCLAAAPVYAQSVDSTGPNPAPPLQSLKPSRSPCSAGSQSVRVCNDDLRSCSSVCNATALDPSADIAGCGLRCCNQFKACLSIRGCASPSLVCF